MTYAEKFCQRLKMLRADRGLTQKQISERLQVVESNYGHYERGESQPSIDRLCVLADVFGVTIDYLVGRQ